nr:hypothetical protein [Candidatus Woesearchaeota archaeon]
MKIKTLLFIVLFLALIPLSLAQNVEITKVEANGIIAQQSGNAIFVERDSELPIKVTLKGLNLADNLRVRAWIGGYEYSNIDYETEVFEVEPNVLYKKYLTLEIPNDISASDDYALHIEVFDDDSSIENTYILRVKEKRHELNVFDVLLRPNIVEAGRPVFVTVRLENLGQKKEQDIKITAQIKDLAVSSSAYIDELTNFEISNEDEETSASSDEIMLFLPKDAKPGVYPLDIIVEYNRGHDIITETHEIMVNGKQVEEKEDSLIKIEPKKRTVTKGQSTQYRVMIANYGNKASTYDLEVEGANLFSNVNINPKQFTVYPDETKQYLITLNTKDITGNYNFIVKVKEGDNIVKEETLSLEIVNVENEVNAFTALIVLAFLVVLLIIVIAIRAFR